MQIIKDILGVLKSLSQIDLLLYFAVVVLIILIVSLLYIIKNSDEEETLTEINPSEEAEDLKDIVTSIELNKPSELEFTDYEKEQEEKAIISYEELLAKNNKGNISYENEVKGEEISIKKINLDTLAEKPKKERPIGFYTYEREEEFLEKLKLLNELLN